MDFIKKIAILSMAAVLVFASVPSTVNAVVPTATEIDVTALIQSRYGEDALENALEEGRVFTVDLGNGEYFTLTPISERAESRLAPTSRTVQLNNSSWTSVINYRSILTQNPTWQVSNWSSNRGAIDVQFAVNGAVVRTITRIPLGFQWDATIAANGANVFVTARSHGSGSASYTIGATTWIGINLPT